jgi:hypothetical protein
VKFYIINNTRITSGHIIWCSQFNFVEKSFIVTKIMLCGHEISREPIYSETMGCHNLFSALPIHKILQAAGSSVAHKRIKPPVDTYIKFQENKARFFKS